MSSYICATYFELTNPVVQNICDKKALGCIMFYKHLLLPVFNTSLTTKKTIQSCRSLNSLSLYSTCEGRSLTA